MSRRSGLERFKKASSSNPFSITIESSSKSFPRPQPSKLSTESPSNAVLQQMTQIGGGQPNWTPPQWAIEPRPGVYYLEVLKDGQTLETIPLNRKRNIFGRQSNACDFVLDHQSISRQHAAVIPHKNGSIFVIDLGSAHGTFVANERLTKETPVELEIGQSLRFAASTRTYILRKNEGAFYNRPQSASEINLTPPDPSDEEALVAYNTLLNRYGISRNALPEKSKASVKKRKRGKVGFADQFGGNLMEIVGYSDGADIGLECGPIGVKEGSLVGKYESLVESVVIPKGKEHVFKESQVGVGSKLREAMSMAKGHRKSSGLYDDLFSGSVGSSWSSNDHLDPPKKLVKASVGLHKDERDDDLFGD